MTVLDDLLAAEGPIASVYLRAPSTTTDAEHRLETRWKNARRRLVEAEASDAVLTQLDVSVAEVAHEDAPAFALFADGKGEHTVVEPLDDALDDDLAAVDSVPRLVPLLHAHQRSVPHVMVMTDRTGADIVAVVDGEAASTDTVEGTDHHIHRGRFGGWSHRRIQQRAENRWEDNARDVAERVSELAHEVGARIVTIAGDVRARQFVLDHLDHPTREVAVVLEAGDSDGIADETVKLVADVVARDTRALLEDHGGRISAATAVEGPDAVFDALTAGRVATLLVVDDTDDQRRAYFDPDGSTVCSTTKTSEAMVEGRMVDVAVRSALLTDAAVRIVPATVLDDDIGALLRW
jgi:peptide subunit release factor 1 (eRF1)